MRILFAPFGSEGDVNPLLWLAGLLTARGHRVEFLLTPHYGHLADRHGFAWHPMGTEADFLRTANNPAIWKPGIGTWLVARAMSGSLPAYQKAFESSGGDFDLVVTSSFGLAAAALAEARGIPRLMLHLQPMCLRSHCDLPAFPGGAGLSRAPAVFLDAVFFCVDAILNRTLLPPLNRFRAGLGLSRLRDFYRDALMRADGLALLAPEWFAPPQPDWPKGLRQFDFPLGGKGPLPQDLLAWLGSGAPPVLWTHGSANVHLAKFHRLAREVTRQIGGRALLVGKVPPGFSLPDGMFFYPHVAFEDVFPRCRAVVHHGGIGTTSKAFAAGIPQLVIPLAHDQHDNAARVERLGAGLEGRPRDASRKLSFLFTSSEIARGVEKCRLLAARSPSRSALLADWAEELAADRKMGLNEFWKSSEVMGHG
ncbi:MAG: nucleotide disphospho-sugar-binding domain-containing protein [Verrucomicrobiae bacterium]